MGGEEYSVVVVVFVGAAIIIILVVGLAAGLRGVESVDDDA